MEIKHGASQRILISVSQNTKYGDIQSDRGCYPSNFNQTSDKPTAWLLYETLRERLPLKLK
ncbi:hypothetical protein [uncultured Nostoc sp.]|uniref:hypothetical protein n=1 Tax=uncultured Nostoc sp. TaxID=340711 RepID=UPI002626D288|nr:hypothetical protein [uncultured Nostoc sp.]